MIATWGGALSLECSEDEEGIKEKQYCSSDST